ncbi:SAM-dependent methyltransferase [Streptomyces anulatus]|uniref:SAM-dependent methyltransferase n=1 Tax=Streptomyces anulatus TaxID=1892 RepID=UPI001C280F63|nr:SAM-dependent methyltransferase [Streptomyces anulatus]
MNPPVDSPLRDASRVEHPEVSDASVTRAMGWLMGERTQSLPSDRALAQQLEKAVPWLEESLEISRAFLYHCAEFLGRNSGIEQFVTLSTGPYRPWPGRRADLQPPCAAVPGSAVVHVRTLAGTGEAGPSCNHPQIYAGLDERLSLLSSPAVEALDRRRPIGVLIDDPGPWTDIDELLSGLDRLRGWLPPGSAIALTHATADLAPAEVRPREDHAVRLRTEATGRPYQPRTRAEIESLLAPWPLAGEGVVATGGFFPDHAHSHLPEHHSSACAALALHPLRADLQAGPGVAGLAADATPEPASKACGVR